MCSLAIYKCTFLQSFWEWIRGTKTHLNAFFVEAFDDLPLVLGDNPRFLHVAQCGKSLLHLHVEVLFNIFTGIIAGVRSRTV